MDQDSNSHPDNPNPPLVDLARSVANRGSQLTGLTSAHTQALIGRVFRLAERSQVWVPNVGSLSPHMVERFSSEVAQRYPDLARKYQVEAADETTEIQNEADALVLAPGGMAAPAIWQPDEDAAALSNPTSRTRPELSETSTPASPPVVIRTPAPVQRRSDVRPISRTEEIKPGLSRTAQDGRPAPSIEPVPTPGDSPLKSTAKYSCHQRR